MAYNETIAIRIREQLKLFPEDFTENNIAEDKVLKVVESKR